MVSIAESEAAEKVGKKGTSVYLLKPQNFTFRSGNDQGMAEFPQGPQTFLSSRVF